MMKQYLLLTSFVLTSCFASEIDTSHQGESEKQNHVFSALVLRNPEFGSVEYKVVYLCDKNEDGFWDLHSRRLELRKSKTLTASLDLPDPDELKNFQVSDIAKTKHGFLIHLSWGGGNHLHRRALYFRFENNKFHIYRIRTYYYSLPSEKSEASNWRLSPSLTINDISISQFLKSDSKEWKSAVVKEDQSISTIQEWLEWEEHDEESSSQTTD